MPLPSMTVCGSFGPGVRVGFKVDVADVVDDVDVVDDDDDDDVDVAPLGTRSDGILYP